MKAKLHRVTVSLEEELIRWARIEAAWQNTSVSRLLGAILKDRMLEDETYKKVTRRSLARKPFLNSNGRYLSRDEAHDRARLR
jgi:hypothetical protein